MSHYTYELIDYQGRLALHSSHPNFEPIVIDFMDAQIAYRRAHPQRELLRKAIQLADCPHPQVIDATAGFGADAFMMASWGAKVTLVEQHNLLAKLLADALLHLPKDLAGELTLIHGDSLQMLATHPGADIIYLDPMYQLPKQSAAVNKRMQILQDLIESPNDDAELFEQAMTVAKHRVVVKRHVKAPTLANKKPTFTLQGKSTRFDIYQR